MDGGRRVPCDRLSRPTDGCSTSVPPVSDAATGRYSAHMTGSENLLVITPTDDGFAVEGEIDAHTAPSLAEAVADAQRPKLSIDLSGVGFIDSSGLRVLIEAHRRAADAGGSLHLTRPSDSVRRLLAISGLDDYLDVD